jgi:DNA-binding transcriptional MerR regulator
MDRHVSERDTAVVGVSVGFADIGFGYNDGYWDNSHHWHTWANDGERTGYRTYGPAELLRGVQIEQLKAGGLGLAAIREVLDAGEPLEEALRRRRRELTALVAEHRTQLATVDALLTARAGLARPALVHAPAVHAVTVRATCHPDDLGPTVRRLVQRLRRRVRAVTATGDGSFSARFPLEVTDVPVVVDVAAHLAAPSPGGVTIPAETRLAVEVVGPIELLPLAYDALLDAGRARHLALGDAVVEHYLDLGAVGRTEVAIPVRDAA